MYKCTPWARFKDIEQSTRSHKCMARWHLRRYSQEEALQWRQRMLGGQNREEDLDSRWQCPTIVNHPSQPCHISKFGTWNRSPSSSELCPRTLTVLSCWRSIVECYLQVSAPLCMEADQKGEKGESKGSKEVPSLQTPEAYWSQLLHDWQSNLNGNNGQSALSPAHLSALSRSPQLAVCRSYANLMRIWTLQCRSEHVVMAPCVIIWCRSTWSHPDVCTL